LEINVGKNVPITKKKAHFLPKVLAMCWDKSVKSGIGIN